MSRSTLPPEVPLERLRRARTARRVFFAVLCGFLLLGVLGVLGVREATVAAAGGGYDLELRYAKVARPGLSVPWSLTLRRAGGFDGPITIATTDAYFDLFDENSLDPEPESSTSDGERIVWEFSPPDEGDTFRLSLDTRIGPNVQWGAKATTEVLEGGSPVVEVGYRTWILP